MPTVRETSPERRKAGLTNAELGRAMRRVETPAPAPQVSFTEPAFQFGSFQLVPTRRLLLSGDITVRLGSRALDILIALVERAGQLVSKDELRARVWPSTTVTEQNLTVHVAALRRALRDGDGGKRYLVNIPGRGYWFVAPVTVEVLGRSTALERDIPAANRSNSDELAKREISTVVIPLASTPAADERSKQVTNTLDAPRTFGPMVDKET
jgi:DNA-binding winged helix-turn-helix (wHTH) protein